jgi:hypothetical protein
MFIYLILKIYLIFIDNIKNVKLNINSQNVLTSCLNGVLALPKEIV